MIWHIFKKDVKLLWWLAAGAAALHFACIFVSLILGLFPDNPRLTLLMYLLDVGGLLAVGFAIAAVVHLDAIPGSRQDWLVRPVRRMDLLLAKLLFVVLMLQLPVFLADFVEPIVSGFPLGSSLAGAASRSAFFLLAVDLPCLAFASLTRNLLEAIAGAVAIFFSVLITVNILRSHPTLGTGVEWVTYSTMSAAAFAGALTVLVIQYFRRRTLAAQCLTGAFVVLFALTSSTPWQPAFAIQKWLSSVHGSSSTVAVSFNPRLGKLSHDSSFLAVDTSPESVPLFLPLRISGLPAGSGLQSDRTEIRVIEPSGRVDLVDPPLPLSSRRDENGDADQSTYHSIAVPGELYRRIKDQPVRLEIDYSLTLFHLASSHALAAVSGSQYISGVGRCGTRINDAETAVQFRCDQAGQKPDCLTFVLEYIPSGQRNSERFGCSADYAPFIDWQAVPDALWRFGTNLPFRDPTGLAKYPVDGSKLKDSRAVMRVYQAVDHFSQTLTIPEIRLSDWEPEGASN